MRTLVFLQIALLVCANSRVGYAVEAVKQANALRLTIDLKKRHLMPCEPAPFRIQIMNVADQEESIPATFEPEFGNLTFTIIGPANKHHKYQPLGQELGGGFEKIQLKPKESLVYDGFLLYSADWGFHFRELGEYSIQAIFDAGIRPEGHVRLTSDVVKLTVVPVDDVNAPALERFGGHPQAKFALTQDTHPFISAEFEAIVKSYPDSAYAPWSYYFLGRKWQTLALEDQLRRQRLGQHGLNRLPSERAIQTYEALLEKHPAFPLAAEVRYQIAKEVLRLGRREEAFDRIEQLGKQYPNVHQLMKAQRAMKRLREAGFEVTAEQLP